MASVASDLAVLRQEYEEVAGKKPYWRWDEDMLRERIGGLLSAGVTAQAHHNKPAAANPFVSNDYSKMRDKVAIFDDPSILQKIDQMQQVAAELPALGRAMGAVCNKISAAQKNKNKVKASYDVVHQDYKRMRDSVVPDGEGGFLNHPLKYLHQAIHPAKSNKQLRAYGNVNLMHEQATTPICLEEDPHQQHLLEAVQMLNTEYTHRAQVAKVDDHLDVILTEEQQVREKLENRQEQVKTLKAQYQKYLDDRKQKPAAQKRKAGMMRAYSLSQGGDTSDSDSDSDGGAGLARTASLRSRTAAAALSGLNGSV